MEKKKNMKVCGKGYIHVEEWMNNSTVAISFARKIINGKNYTGLFLPGVTLCFLAQSYFCDNP